MTKELQQRRELRAKGRAIALDLILQRGLYSSFDATTVEGADATAVIREAQIGTFDCYCTGCGQTTPFIATAIPPKYSGGGLRNDNALANPPFVHCLRAVCQRDLTAYLYVFRMIDGRTTKIGQLPSMSDISFGELKDIDKGLPPLDRKELGTALGLFSHDAASGAFVYLRRVFERMISRTNDRLIEGGGQGVERFSEMRMDEKIDALKAELPQRAVKNRRVFSVLSQGIHELTDEQCKVLFPLVKAVIFLMLEEEDHKRRKALAEQETDAAFQAALTAGIEFAADSPVGG